MSNIFNVAEVVDMGIEKEKRRRDFYALTAEKFEDKKIKELFTKLCDWEKEHITKFIEIRSSLEQEKAQETYADELAGYINVLVDEKLYKDITPESFSKNIPNPKAAIERGMEFEKDAILFFAELLNSVEDGNKETIKRLMDEEKKHLLYLFQLKTEYE